MTLQEYTAIIAKSVAESGYNSFLPSACVSSAEKEVMYVLETNLTEEGDASIALDWASSLEVEGSTLFAAYRDGMRVVAVVELKKSRVVGKVEIQVNPYVEK